VPPLRFVVLGDSIGYGTGASRPEDSLGRRLHAELTDAGFAVDLHVLAVPGAISAHLADQARRARPLRPDLALVVVGANDLARFVPAEQAAGALGRTVEELRSTGADVVVVPAPDMSSVPFVPPALRPAVQAACRVLQRRQHDLAGAAGATVVDIPGALGRAFTADPLLFAADRFHPSSAGYALIAATLAPVVLGVAERRRDRGTAA
jgi:lysophospholipase L1-like esterase